MQQHLYAKQLLQNSRPIFPKEPRLRHPQSRRPHHQLHCLPADLLQVLVVFQFTLSAILIVATIVCWQQLHFMQTRDLGFDKEQVVAMPLRTSKQSQSVLLLKQEMKKTAQLSETTASSKIPGLQLNNIVTLPEGVPVHRQQSMFTLVVDSRYVSIPATQGPPSQRWRPPGKRCCQTTPLNIGL